MCRVWRAGPGHGPFNSVWANPTRSSCHVWTVASVRSADPARHDFFVQNSYNMCTIYIQY
ncbi:hypothetical protein Zm00014a_007015 [Zea mays]|uniref:Uncharacterized protein n=1 Tax=Zea mays TaxID=4577 RepID=A0A3L6FC10_MAIZE|nr:hypothetical protein Zm00014a_007015 [Zea mays]